MRLDYANFQVAATSRPELPSSNVHLESLNEFHYGRHGSPSLKAPSKTGNRHTVSQSGAGAAYVHTAAMLQHLASLDDRLRIKQVETIQACSKAIVT